MPRAAPTSPASPARISTRAASSWVGSRFMRARPRLPALLRAHPKRGLLSEQHAHAPASVCRLASSQMRNAGSRSEVLEQAFQRPLEVQQEVRAPGLRLSRMSTGRRLRATGRSGSPACRRRGRRNPVIEGSGSSCAPGAGEAPSSSVSLHRSPTSRSRVSVAASESAR
jgi:hypothetical protein